MNDNNILQIENLNVNFKTFDGVFSAVRDVNLAVKNQSIGIIGESGCGKSTLSFSIMLT